MTKPRSKNRKPPRKTKRKSAKLHAPTKALPDAGNVTHVASRVRTFSTLDAAVEWFTAQRPDPSKALGAFYEYLDLKSQRLRENPLYVWAVYRRYRSRGPGEPAPEWVLKQLEEWGGELLDNPRKSMNDIMGLSGRGRGTRPAINDAQEWNRTIEFFLEMARLRYFGFSMDKAAEIVCTLAEETDPDSWKRNSISSERLAHLYSKKWPERSAAERYMQVQLGQWPEDLRSQYVKKIPLALVPKHLHYLYNLPSKK